MDRFCRLCLTASLNVFKKVVDINPKCFEVCLPEMELGVVDSLVVCTYCANALETSYEFKTMCLGTEEIIKKHLKNYFVTNSDDTNLNDPASCKEQVDDNQPNVDGAIADVAQEVKDGNEETECIVTPTFKVENNSLIEEDISQAREDAIEESALLCDICNASFSTGDSLSEHVGLHFIIKCEYCKKYFKDSLASEVHMKEVHKLNYENSYSCDICSQTFAEKKYLLLHIFLHFEEPSCWTCQRSFSNATSLKQHMLHEHSITIDFSKKTYEDHKEFDNVYFEVDEDRLMESILKHLKKYVLDKGVNSPVDYPCEICNQSFNLKSSLHDHIKLHFRRSKCVTCNKTFYNSFCLKRHVSDSHQLKADISNEDGNGIEYFEECDKNREVNADCFEAPNYQLQNYYSISNWSTNAYTCSRCHKTFPMRISLDLHVNAVHVWRENRFRNKRYEEQFRTKNHSRNNSSATREYRCEVCKRRFLSRKDLIEHLRSYSHELHYESKRRKERFCMSNHRRDHRNSHYL